MFCLYTVGGGLAKKLREAEEGMEGMEQLTGFRIKIVEEVGE